MSNVHPFPATSDEDAGDYVDRRVPVSLAAEQSVLSAVMYDASKLEAVDFLAATDFYHPAHRLVWTVVQRLAADGKHTGPVAVQTEIERLGQLRAVRGGDYVWEIANIPVAGVEYHAEVVFEKARARRAADLLIRAQQALDSGATADDVDRILTEHQAAEQARTDRATGAGPSHLLASALNWGEFLSTDFGAVQLLLGQLLAPGQQIAIVGDGKAGKSLFAEEWLWRASAGMRFLGDQPQAPIRVLYLDAENGHPELQARFLAFGATPESLANFVYLSFPPIRPLDTPGGGADLVALAKATQADLVVLDTVSRFIEGKENDSDPWLALYRHTTMPLKAAGIASVRLDHLGKDSEKGARGSSAKTQDVDHVWELRAQSDEILTLKRTHSRTGIGPAQFTILRKGRQIDGKTWAPGETRHELMTFGDRATLIEGSVEYIIDRLEKGGVDPTWGVPRVRDWCGAHGVRARKDKIEEAVRQRKAKATKAAKDLPPHLPYPPVTTTPPDAGGGQHKTPAQTSPGEVRGTPGDVPTAPPSPHPLPKEGGGGAHRGTNEPICAICHEPYSADWAARGYDSHLTCDAPRNEP